MSMNQNPGSIPESYLYTRPCPYTNQRCPNTPRIIRYTIQAGDTIWKLAERYNISVDAILAANPNIDPDNLQVGQVILIPDPPMDGWHERDEEWRRGFRPWWRPWWFGPWHGWW